MDVRFEAVDVEQMSPSDTDRISLLIPENNKPFQPSTSVWCCHCQDSVNTCNYNKDLDL